MTVTFAKCLDRPFAVLGLRGAWVGVFVGMAVASVILAVACGACLGGGVGVASAFAFGALSYIFCFLRQRRVSHRALARIRAAGGCSILVTRRRTVARILRPRGAEEGAGSAGRAGS